MNSSTGGKLAVGTLCLALASWWAFSYHISQYHGDGEIRDSGVWTYPRYHVELGRIPLYETGVHRFQLTGLPSEKMTLKLVALGKTEKDRAELTGLKVKITAKLVDDRGHPVCTASGSPSDGIREDAWILTSSDVGAAFYNHSCVDVQIRRRSSYTLELTLTEVDSDSPKTFLAPTISGGGNELP